MRGIEAYQMRKIYAIGNALGINGGGHEDALHSLISAVTGKDSVKSLSFREASDVILRLEALQKDSAAPVFTSKKKGRKLHPEHPDGITEGQQRKVWALMYQLREYDTVPETAEIGDRLCALIRREFHCDVIRKNPFAWFSFEDGSKLIEILKNYINNAERKAERDGDP